MRALLVNPRSPHSFWTFEKTVGALGKRSVGIPLALATIAALLPDEWELKLVDREYQEISQALWEWADMILITGMIAHHEDMLAVITEAKNRGKRVVVGGPYASLVPDRLVEAGADFVVVGEGESAVPIWLEALGRGATRAIIHEDGKPDLTRSPVPRFDLVDLDAYVMGAVQTSRGCPYGCEFCDIASLYGIKQRHKTADQVIAELELLHALGWRQRIFFSDDNFIGGKSHARAILEKLTPWMEQHGKPFDFWTQTSVNLGHDPELIDLMTAANFDFVFLGIETPDEDVLRQSKKMQNVIKPLEQAVRTINARGLTVIGSFIIGFDGEKKGAGDRVREFVEKTSIPLVMVNALQAVPRTPLWERLEQAGRLLPDVPVPDLLTGTTMNFVPTRPEQEIIGEFLELSLHLYEPSRYLERAYNFYLTMRPTRKALALREGKTESGQQASSHGQDRRRPLKDFFLFMRLVWLHGVVGYYRRQFWKQLFGMYRKNPSRFVAYLNSIAIGENLFALGAVIRKRLGSERAASG